MIFENLKNKYVKYIIPVLYSSPMPVLANHYYDEPDDSKSGIISAMFANWTLLICFLVWGAISGLVYSKTDNEVLSGIIGAIITILCVIFIPALIKLISVLSLIYIVIKILRWKNII